MAENSVHIAAESLGQIGGFPVTNSLIFTWLVMAVLIGVALVMRARIALNPAGGVANFLEWGFESFLGLVDSTTGSIKLTRKFFTLVATFFFFILVANLMGLLPGVGTVGFSRGEEFVPLLRPVAADLNTTFALAIFSVVATHYMSVREIGLKSYLGKFFSINPIFLFVGLLELISEFTKVVSLSFRLFGNIFAGETVLTTVSGIFAFGVPLPFMLLELVVAVVQALVFAMLTLAFLILLTQKSHH